MIISITIENWMSFRQATTFSMVASRERQHGERVPKLDKYQTRVLPIAAIYGGNASGKTNFFKAIRFAQWMIVKGTHPDSVIPVEPFRLDDSASEQASRFSLELLIDDTIYAYNFAVTKWAVTEESLVVINSSSEKVLFDRKADEVIFDASLKKDEFIKYAFHGTRDNQLFLTNSVSQKVENFRPVYDWFKDKLELVAPDSRFAAFEQYLDDAHPRFAAMNAVLSRLDTGISRLGGAEVRFDSLDFPEEVKSKLLEDVTEGETVRILYKKADEHYLVSMKNGSLVAKRLHSFHKLSDGTEVKFEMNQESDGSKRVIDLLPAFLDLSTENSDKVYIIDELDRSLHTSLSNTLLNYYLGTCSTKSRAQLLFTTHDVQLMDQSLLRRDEMWVAERSAQGYSSLIAFSDYKDIRYDKDIRKSYLQGRLGGVPRIAQGSLPEMSLRVAE
ncbi:AAA family ATPase [Leucothrix pacifica]|uniref:Abortive phage resistance protein n=1 Tax=Leucothrix pacifica TaxID=1247513 RepID=A0A317CAB0_9GAMM|nr:ATP-binding protein [Leucothrix pacifica]PWQ93310.1 abortive phage resistance protein [Leucothrix pacifica]